MPFSVILNKLKPRKSLNKAYLKVKPNRSEIEVFKKNLIQLIDQTNDTESEEFHKNLVSDFLKKTYYDPNHSINTKGKNDLVIHNGKDAKSSVGVIIEAKKPTNKMEMVTTENLNKKAFQELVLYYLRERIAQKNLEIKYLLATNVNEWFVFDATTFDRLFAQNKKLVKQYEDFEGGRLSGTKTDFFYKQVVEPFIRELQYTIDFTHFDLREYDQLLRHGDRKDDNKLIALFKLFSPEHLLKLPFANDSNSLDKKFYSELLHIIGLTETKDKGKKIIQRNKAGERNAGSLLENAVIQLDTLDKIHRLEKASQYGETKAEQLFNVGLELSITWVNRMLFLKLLEAQLIAYHKGNVSYSFLNFKKINSYDDLNSLFFQVLAKQHDERTEDVKTKFAKVPYLNSSLFEPNELEHNTIFISNLPDDRKLPILSATVLKDENGKKRTGQLNALEYFFAFLEAYDFSSEGSEDIQEENKTLINASVLGLIFEKINGYKDGSFFTPGFITMYMCRETIRRAVVQKFNDTKGWNCKDLDDLYNEIEDRQEANDIINSLKICDPAVGSGHFLVSALNELIAIKHDLKILQDREGKRLKEYVLEVVNDELVITDDNGELFEYSMHNKESRRLQEALFHEKQTMIENCLFGVDINPNSVKICRLRLWIELLKNAYYKNETELETLPNIDINIKCGNSLISRFDLDADIKEALKKSNWSIDSYRMAVDTYRNATSKEQKKEMERLIEDIKGDFRVEIAKNDPLKKRLRAHEGDLFNLTRQAKLFGMTQKEKRNFEDSVAFHEKTIEKLEKEIHEIENNTIYDNAFEWRFEFPEVLNADGDFVGFDVVIGNPPYINANDFKKLVGEREYKFYKSIYATAKGTVDVYIYFFELGFKILGDNQKFCFITPNRFLSANYGVALRKFILDKFKILSIGDYSKVKVFSEASTYPIVTLLEKNSTDKEYKFNSYSFLEQNHTYKFRYFNSKLLTYFNDNILGFLLSDKFEITRKIIDSSIPLENVGKINATSTAGEAEAFHEYISEEIEGFRLINSGTIDAYSTTWGISNMADKGQKYINPYLPKDPIKLGANRYSLYSNPKIILAKIALRTEAFYDVDGVYSSINTNCIHSFSDNYDPFFVCAWLNSKLYQYLFECFFDGLRMAGGYLLYSAPNLLNTYIKNYNDLNQIDISAKSERILALKKENPKADTSALEAEIDQLVYELYDLTAEEIKLVEASVK